MFGPDGLGTREPLEVLEQDINEVKVVFLGRLLVANKSR